MSFKQKNKNAGKLWRKNHREQLLAAGLPESVVDNDRSWNYMMLHGDDEFQSGWYSSRLSREQAHHLLQILQSQSFWTETEHEIFQALNKRIERDSD